MNAQPKRNDANDSVRQALKRTPRAVLRALYRNWPWKLLALLLALGLWAVLISQDPTLTRERVFTDVSISVTGADSLRRNSQLIVVSGLEEEALTARMSVDVPQREYNSVYASYYNPRVDLTRVTSPGEQELRVLTTSTTTYGTVTGISPESVTVVVDEYVVNYRVPVSINISGEYPEGFYGPAPSQDPSVVAVSGPKSVVDSVARIYVDFDLSSLPAQAGEVRTALPMRFVDSDGNELDGSLLEVSSADVVLRTITVEQSLYPTRQIPLSDLVLTEGEPATGYSVTNISVSPASVLAAGEQTELDAVDSLFVVDPVDISGLSESTTVEVRIQKPTELVYVSPDRVTITVEIEPTMISRTFSSMRLSVRGSQSGQSVGLSASSVSAVLTGPENLISSLYESGVAAYVNVSGLEPGTYELPVLIYLEGEDMTGVTYTPTPSVVTVDVGEP